MPKLTKQQIIAINNSYKNFIGPINDNNYKAKFTDFVNQASNLIQNNNLTEANKNELIGVYLAATTINRKYSDFDFASNFKYSELDNKVFQKTGVNVSQLESLYRNKDQMEDLGEIGEDGKQIENIEVQKPEPIDLLNLEKSEINLDSSKKEEIIKEEKKEEINIEKVDNNIDIKQPEEESHAAERNNAFVEVHDFQSFMDNFGIKDNHDEGLQELKNISYRVEKSGIDAIKSNENMFKYYKAVRLENGEFANFGKVKFGVDTLKEAQKNYNEINGFKRFLSHFGFFSDVTKQREEINKMKDVLHGQYIDDNTINGISNGTIKELPQETLEKRADFEKEKNKFFKDYVREMEATAQLKMERDPSMNNSQLISKYNNELIDKYKVKAEMKAIDDIIPTMKENIDNRYGKDAHRKFKDQSFTDDLKKEGQYESYLEIMNELNKTYKSVHPKGLSKEQAEVKFLKDMLSGSNFDYSKDLELHLQQEKDKYISNYVNDKLNKLYKNGIISEDEKNQYIKYDFSVKSQEQVIDNDDDLDKNLNINNLEKANDKLKDLSNDTNMEKTDSKLSEFKNEEQNKKLEINVPKNE